MTANKLPLLQVMGACSWHYASIVVACLLLQASVASPPDPLEHIQSSLKNAVASEHCHYEECCSKLRLVFMGPGNGTGSAMVAAGSSGAAPDWGHFSSCRGIATARYCLVERMADYPPRFQFYNVNTAVDAQALCVPDVCSAAMIEDILNSYMEAVLVRVSCSPKSETKGTLSEIMFWVAVVAVGLIMLGQLIAGTLHYCTVFGKRTKTQPYPTHAVAVDGEGREYITMEADAGSMHQASERLLSEDSEDAGFRDDGVAGTPDRPNGSLLLSSQSKARQGFALMIYAFSPQEGIAHILKVGSASRPEGIEDGQWHIGALDGVRGLSFMWLALGQTCLLILPYLSNTEYFLNDVLTQFAIQPVVAASLGGDMFLYLSGFVTCMSLLRIFVWYDGWCMKAVITAWARRLIRVYPSYIVMLIIYAIVLPRLGDGPLWDRVVVDPAGYCQGSWWSNLLFLSNFVEDSRHQCYPGSWYLSMMMQLTVLAPGFVFLYHKNNILGWIVILMATLGVHIFVTYVSLTNDYSMNFFAGAAANEHYWRNIFTQTMPRSSVYLAGIFSGFLVNQSAWGEKGVNKYIAMVMHTTGIITVGFQCLGQAGSYEHGPDGPQFAHWQQALYLASTRFLMVGAVGKMLTLAITGNGFVCTPFLSSRIFRMMSPLLYSAFLIQPVVLTWLYGTQREPIPFAYSTILAYWFGSTALTLVLSTILYVSVERPSRVLADAILPDRPLPARAPMRDPSKVRSFLVDT